MQACFVNVVFCAIIIFMLFNKCKFFYILYKGKNIVVFVFFCAIHNTLDKRFDMTSSAPPRPPNPFIVILWLMSE